MVKFNRLFVVPDNSKTILDVEIEDLCYFENMFITGVSIDTKSTYVTSGPSSSPRYSKNILDYSGLTGDIDLCEYFQGVIPKHSSVDRGLKRLRLVIPKSELDPTNEILFVYIHVSGIPHPSTPCGEDKTYEMRITFNKANLYTEGVRLIKSHLGDIKDPTSKDENKMKLVDYILRYNAFNVALEAGRYKEAIELSEYIFKPQDAALNASSEDRRKNCGCY